jgi:hypothetical protein
VAIAFCAIGAVWAVIAAVQIQPAYERMFTDFGSEVPNITQFALKRWVPLVIAAIPPTLLAAGVLGRAGRSTRLVLMAMVIFLTLAAPTALWIALNQPIFDLAGALK